MSKFPTDTIQIPFEWSNSVGLTLYRNQTKNHKEKKNKN